MGCLVCLGPIFTKLVISCLALMDAHARNFRRSRGLGLSCLTKESNRGAGVLYGPLRLVMAREVLLPMDMRWPKLEREDVSIYTSAP